MEHSIELNIIWECLILRNKKTLPKFQMNFFLKNKEVNKIRSKWQLNTFHGSKEKKLYVDHTHLFLRRFFFL